MIDTNLYLIPISNSLYTRGYSRTLILDGYKQEVQFIPNILHQILLEHKHNTVKNILKSYPQQYSNQILEYLEYLNNNRLAYFGEKHETKLFPDFNMDWDFPSEISNAIIEIKDIEKIDYLDIINQLDEINCFYLEINCHDKIDYNTFKSFLKSVNSKSFRTISLSISYQNFKEIEIEELAKEISKINRIFVYNSPKEEIKKFEDIFSSIIYLNSSNDERCGKIAINSFSKRIEHFTEAQNHNTCLNRKICIDTEGNIKNCPNMSQSFGNIKDTTLQQAIEKQGFKDLWFVHKDQIDVCKDCEFRYMCTDCRGFIKDPENIYSQPVKCGYNPYIYKWQGEKDWISVEQWRKENQNWEEEE